MLGELGFELGDAPVGEADVGACGLQPFFQRPVVLSELADALLECGVLGGGWLIDVFGEFAFSVADWVQFLFGGAAAGLDRGCRAFRRHAVVSSPSETPGSSPGPACSSTAALARSVARNPVFQRRWK